MTEEMGAPKTLSEGLQADMGFAHFETARDVLRDFSFSEINGMSEIRREPIGVCGFITPWNWPMNQIGCKAAPAIATGCTAIWKPSEVSPLSADILTEVFDEAGVPAGVINMVHGDGPTVGAAISSHPLIDMVSFTGSTRAGVAVAQAAAPTVKRVSQELGGKSANIILDDLDDDAFEQALVQSLGILTMNSGQNCNAPSRMLVPKARMVRAKQILAAAAAAIKVGDPKLAETNMGPVVSTTQWNRIQSLIETAMKEQASLVAGGPGRPDGIAKGAYVQPTIFADVTNDMTIAREEVFGPVLAVIGYDYEDDAVRIANDSIYGLSGYVFGADTQHARAVAAKLRTGMVHINGQAGDMHAPFGGYKQSGNGREWGPHGFDEFLEIKAVIGVA
jgi:aldehyde dehydrogenase (NAD+)